MTLPRTAADVLSGHVVFEIESIDRMYLNVWQPRLQHGAGAAAFFTSHRGHQATDTESPGLTSHPGQANIRSCREVSVAQRGPTASGSRELLS
jgi:hypothetical protein